MRVFAIFATLAALISAGNVIAEGNTATSSSSPALDATFGSGGVVILDTTRADPAVNAVDRNPVISQGPDGTLLVAWQCTVLSGKYKMCATHLDATGAPVEGFGDSTYTEPGVAVVEVNNNHNYAAMIGMTSDGSVRIAGYCVVGTSADICAAGLTETGAVDTTIGETGVVVHDYEGSKDWMYHGEMINDGIVTVGSCKDSNYHTCIARYDTNGALDPSFSGDGWAWHSVGVHQSYLRDFVMNDDGSMWAAGQCVDSGTDADTCVYRFTANGELDTSFNGSGTLIIDMSDVDQGRAIEQRSDGDLWIGGFCKDNGGDSDVCVSRVTPTGSVVDTGRFDFGGNADDTMQWATAGIDADDRFVIAATCGESPVICVARFSDDTEIALDTTFDDDGIMALDPTSGDDKVWSQLLVEPGSITLAGTCNDGASVVCIMRISDPTSLPTTTTTTTTTTTSTTTTTAAPTTTSTSSSTTTTSPDNDPALLVGAPPSLSAGLATTAIDGNEVETTSNFESNESNTSWSLQNDQAETVFSWPTASTRRVGESRVLIGGSVGSVSSEGFAPLTPVVVELHSLDSATATDLARGTSSALGTFEADIALPANAVGNHVVRVLGATPNGSVRDVSLGINITAQQSLPATGTQYAATWALLLAALGVLVLLGRRHSAV